MLPSGPKLVSHTTIQHVANPDFIDDPKPPKAPVPQLTDDIDEDDGPSNPNNDSLPSLGDPKHKFFGETPPPTISLIGVVALSG